MCMIFAGQDPQSYAFKTRSFRLRGHVTSVRLEAAFWDVLEEIVAAQGMTLARFLTELHDEVIELHGDIGNFSSLLRCGCITWMTNPAMRDQTLLARKGRGLPQHRQLMQIPAE
jgi:predicted DNA-binding ribbon-helix-helix protein